MTKRIIAIIAALLLGLNQVAAQSLTLVGVGSFGSNLPNQIIYQSRANCTGSGCSLSGVSFGTAQANRYIIVGVSASSCTSGITVTVGGVTATLLKSFSVSFIYGAAVPTGTTGNIVLTGCTDAMSVGYWTIYGLNSLTPDATCQVSGSSACSLSASNAAGYIIGLSSTTTGSISCTMTGTAATTDFNSTYQTNQGSMGGHAKGTGSAYSFTNTGTNCSINVGTAIH